MTDTSTRVNLARTVDRERKKTASVAVSTHSNWWKLRQWSKGVVEAPSTLQASKSLREYSKLRRKVIEATLRSKVSLRAYAKLRSIVVHIC